jgi:hypothetical protein
MNVMKNITLEIEDLMNFRENNYGVEKYRSY